MTTGPIRGIKFDCFSMDIWNGVFVPLMAPPLLSAFIEFMRRDFEACGFMWLSMCFFTSGSVAKRRRQFGIGQQNGRSPWKCEREGYDKLKKCPLLKWNLERIRCKILNLKYLSVIWPTLYYMYQDGNCQC